MQTLTKEQQHALEMEGRRCVCIAGPGAGKTHLMVERIDQDAARNDQARQVVVTFTNAAANELRERLEARGMDTRQICHLGTLHSWAARELRLQGALGTIISQRELIAHIADIKKKLGAPARNLSMPEVWRATLEPPPFGIKRKIGKALRNRLRQHRETHPDLLLHEFAELIEQGEVTPPDRIYVDEYQDSAPIDARIYETLAELGSRLYLIGDPRQAIYGFRGATEMNLHAAWQAADQRAQLTINHRSADIICGLASWIAKAIVGHQPLDHRVIAANADNKGHIATFEYDDHASEMLAAAKWVGASPTETSAILCRYNSQARAIAGILRSRGMTVTCSADPEQDNSASLTAAVEQIQMTDELPRSIDDPEDWWQKRLTRLGIPFRLQAILIPRLRACRTPDDLLTLEGGPDTEAGPVHVATIHGAKGLEWDRVWVFGADERAFPATAEAARMIFVAITRARRELVTSHSHSRPEPESGRTLQHLKATRSLP